MLRTALKLSLSTYLFFNAVTSAASPFTPNNLVVMTIGQQELTAEGQFVASRHLQEYTIDGQFVQSIKVPRPIDSITEYPRDFVIKGDTTYLYNGTFDPYLSTYNSSTELWSQTTTPGWSTINGLGLGGIDVYNDYVFVTDMSTYSRDGIDEASGIVRFDLFNGVEQRFAEGLQMIDLTVGQDGLLYGLSGTQGVINVFNPSTLENVSSISSLGASNIAVDSNSNIYTAFYGDIKKLDLNGNLIASFDICSTLGLTSICNFLDIDISNKGDLVLRDREGLVYITDTNFSSSHVFETDYFGGQFIDFVEEEVQSVPEPSTGLLALFGLISTIMIRRKIS